MSSSVKSPARRGKAVPEGSLSCFYISSKGKKPVSRKKFDPRRRAEVAAVRKRGACLRCRLLKIKCDEKEPCSTCLTLASKAMKMHERKVLQFTDCIRTSLKSISIFSHALPEPNAQTVILLKAKNFAPTITTIYYGSQIEWDEEVLVNDLAALFNNFESYKPLMRGPLSSAGFFDLVQTLAGEENTAYFQRLMYLHFMTDLDPASHISFEASELLQLYAIAGHQCLDFLDRKLSIQSLAASSQKDLRILFFLVSSTISAISFTRPTTDSLGFPSIEEDTNDRTLFDAMQEHLCRTLAHFVVYLSAHLNVQLSRGAEQALLTASPTSWRTIAKTPEEWRKGELAALQPQDHFASSRDLADISKCSVLIDSENSMLDIHMEPVEPNFSAGSSKMVGYNNVYTSCCIPQSIQPDPAPLPIFPQTQCSLWSDKTHGMMFFHSETLPAEDDIQVLPTTDKVILPIPSNPEGETIDAPLNGVGWFNSDIVAEDTDWGFDTGQDLVSPAECQTFSVPPNSDTVPNSLARARTLFKVDPTSEKTSKFSDVLSTNNGKPDTPLPKRLNDD